MGVEPTQSSFEPHTGFEDQERHQVALHLRGDVARRLWISAAEPASPLRGRVMTCSAEQRDVRISIRKAQALDMPDAPINASSSWSVAVFSRFRHGSRIGHDFRVVGKLAESGRQVRTTEILPSQSGKDIGHYYRRASCTSLGIA